MTPTVRWNAAVKELAEAHPTPRCPFRDRTRQPGPWRTTARPA
ncbi:hypothetical protein [Streptomyces sp. SAS_276]